MISEKHNGQDGWIAVKSTEELFRECRERQLQSLLVEGGRHTLQSFIDRGLWDEIRVETSSCEISAVPSSPHTAAPVLPANATPFRTETYDGNTIVVYRPQFFVNPAEKMLT